MMYPDPLKEEQEPVLVNAWDNLIEKWLDVAKARANLWAKKRDLEEACEIAFKLMGDRLEEYMVVHNDDTTYLVKIDIEEWALKDIIIVPRRVISK